MNHPPGQVLVTGGSGFLARHCISQLLAAGWRVRTTLRDASQEAGLRNGLTHLAADGQRLRVAVADLERDAGWREAVADCTHVLHVASPLPRDVPKDDDALLRPARDGTLRVLAAAADAGVRRVVMTSSTAAVAYGHPPRATPFTEADWSIPDPADTSAYERAKLAAERAAWDWAAATRDAPELVAICPGALLGPAIGGRMSASAQIVGKLLDGSLPGLPRLGFPLVDVRDVADLHLRALVAPAAAGQRYIATGPVLWMSEIAQVVRDEFPALADRLPRRALPDFVVRLSALFDPVTRSRLFELGKVRPASSSKAWQELRWEPRPVRATLRATVEGLLDAGQVPVRTVRGRDAA